VKHWLHPLHEPCLSWGRGGREAGRTRRYSTRPPGRLSLSSGREVLDELVVLRLARDPRHDVADEEGEERQEHEEPAERVKQPRALRQRGVDSLGHRAGQQVEARHEQVEPEGEDDGGERRCDLGDPHVAVLLASEVRDDRDAHEDLDEHDGDDRDRAHPEEQIEHRVEADDGEDDHDEGGERRDERNTDLRRARLVGRADPCGQHATAPESEEVARGRVLEGEEPGEEARDDEHGHDEHGPATHVLVGEAEQHALGCGEAVRALEHLVNEGGAAEAGHHGEGDDREEQRDDPDGDIGRDRHRALGVF